MSAMGGESRPVVCCDLDGVVWRGETAIDGSAAAIAQLRDAGLRVVFLTNNSNGRVQDNVDRLAAVGIAAAPDDVASSAQAAAALLARGRAPADASGSKSASADALRAPGSASADALRAPGDAPADASGSKSAPADALRARGDAPADASQVLACAGPGVVEALEEHGFAIVDTVSSDLAAVVVGWHREFDFERLRRAADGVRSGARFIATNLDPTYPGAQGLLPGAGSLVAAVATAGGRRPEVAGKPEPAMAALVHARYAQPVVMIGDRPSTDGAFATALGVPFALVLSGIAGTAGEEAVPDPAPAFVAADLRALAPMLVGAFARESR